MTRPLCIVEPSASNEKNFVRILEALCDAAVLVNVDYLREHPLTVALYDSSVRYQLDESNSENVYTIPLILRRGHADCDGLAAWRAAEIRVRERFHSRVRLQKRADGWYHARATNRKGYEDPTAILLAIGRG